jgi:hypothetical protein
VFCGLLHDYGGLQNLVDQAEYLPPNPDRQTLRFVVISSSDAPTRTAMVGLYKQVVRTRQLSHRYRPDRIIEGNECMRRIET